MAYEGSVGAYIEVSASLPATEDQLGYEALTWTKVNGVTNLGEFGKSFSLVTGVLLETGLTVKRKGAFDNGSMAVTMLRDTSDAGQGIIQTSADDASSTISLHIVEPDGTSNYCQVSILGAPVNLASASEMKQTNSQFEITTDIVVV